MKKKKSITKRVQDNFYSIIIFLVLFFTVILIISLFYPVSTEGLPENEMALNLLDTGIDQRTVIIRSISSIISGISVIIAFISIKQSRESEISRERMQVMPFPAYALPKETEQNVISNEATNRGKVPIDFTWMIRIRNIGLGSLVDYQINQAWIKTSPKISIQLDLAFSSNFILGKEEEVTIALTMQKPKDVKEDINVKHFEKIYVECSFLDLLGNEYIQEFIIHSTISTHNKALQADDKTYEDDLFVPSNITHNHPHLNI